MASATAQAQSYEMVIATQLPEDMSNNEIYPALVHFDIHRPLHQRF